MNLEAFSQAVRLVNDSASDPTMWRQSLGAVGTLFSASSVSLITRDMAAMRGRWISTHDRATEQEFWHRWRRRNPFALRAVTPRPHAIEADYDIVPRAELLRGAYYNEFLRSRDIHTMLQLWLKRQGSVQPSLSITRGPNQEPFGAAEFELARAFLPHLQYAVGFARRIHPASFDSSATVDALDMVNNAVLLLDAVGRLVHANRAGEALLAERDGISLESGRLRATSATLSRRLDAVLAMSCASAGDFPAGGALRLPRPSGKPALALLAIPLACRAVWLPRRQPAVGVTIVDPGASPPAFAEWLRALFALTAAEARVACQLAGNARVADIADRLAVSRHTVRVHLARIMEKTGTSRQSELVALLTRLPAVPLPTA